MKKYLVTGCAGFIGSNFVYYMLKKYDDILLVNLDKLTYAGNLENLKGVEGDPRHVFVQGDICDKELVASLFEKYDFDCVINFAAESHVDRSIVKTIIEQLHDRLKDDGISEDLIRHVEDRLGHDRRYGIDPTKIRNDLGWYPETPFEKGIVLTIDWYLEHEDWMNSVTSGNYQKYYEEMYRAKAEV